MRRGGSVFINESKNILITVTAAMAVIDGSLTLGMMIAIQYIIGQLNSPVEQLVAFIYNWQDVSISLDRMNEIHTQMNEENETKAVNTIQADDKSIAVCNLDLEWFMSELR